MVSDIEITTINSVHSKIFCDRGISKEMSDYFTFKVPNYKYHPAYRNKIWDGQIRLFNIHKKTLYVGLLPYVFQFALERNYTITSDYKIKEKLKLEDTRKFITDVIKPTVSNSYITPHDHQIDAVNHAINHERCLLLSATGSGKSLIIYSLIRYYLSLLPKESKLLVIVPTTNLVSQMFSDFEDYSSNSDWSVKKYCYKIYQGRDKKTNKRVVISTWQSLYNMPEEYFKEFNVVFGDEAHLYKAKSLTGIMEKLKICPYRIGTTGTLDNSKTHKLVTEGLFGKVYKVASAKELINKNILTNLNIDFLNLNYSDEERLETKRMKYHDEIKWLTESKKRNNFIINLTKTIKGNTLVLFNYVESHGKPLYTAILESNKESKSCYMIYGGTDVEQREEIRKRFDSEENAILVASYGTCSTGINLKNIHNIIFASPSKSVIRVLQSIGRGLRKSDSKDFVKLYDICDDLKYRKYVNHTFRHADERIKIYSNEGFSFKKIEIDL
jgi:superfamily II DNA or RNA helicase